MARLCVVDSAPCVLNHHSTKPSLQSKFHLRYFMHVRAVSESSYHVRSYVCRKTGFVIHISISSKSFNYISGSGDAASGVRY